MWEITHIFLTRGSARTGAPVLSHMQIVAQRRLTGRFDNDSEDANGAGISVEHQHVHSDFS
ncbi:hypothetical protein NH14_018215 [Paraburkholderia sacchari]|uniref:Uncharacterized protein n=1 Tax=Paraburkholderia sacchari TaxID=159450 RepID=A0A8T6ZHI4_9BURK|nr:hypothetical protein [Paraburkholderia sacchari]